MATRTNDGLPYTNREGCDFEWLDDDEFCCLGHAEYVIFATFEADAGGVSVHAPMYVCEYHFSEQLPRYTQKWRMEKRLLTLTVVPLAH